MDRIDPDDLSSSRDLVRAASEGAPDALEDLVTRHLPGVRAYVRLNAGPLIRRKESTEDIVQSACRELLGDLNGIEYHSEARFKNWLYTAVFSKIRDKLRHYHAQKRDVARESPAPSALGIDGLAGLVEAIATPSRDAVAREDVEALEHIISELPDEYRDIIIQVRIIGLGYAEIAAETGKSEVALRKLYSRASAHLLRRLMRPG